MTISESGYGVAVYRDNYWNGKLPAAITANSGEMQVDFISDRCKTERGFFANVSVVIL